jgi:hypothetical protein
VRLPNTAHTSQPWRIHNLVPDFQLEDVWELPGGSGANDFRRFVESIASMDPTHSSSPAVRGLFAVREKLGALLGLDSPGEGVGSRVPSLRDRLPPDLRDTPGPAFGTGPFTSLYLTDNEWAAEAANKTVHGVLHIGRVGGATNGDRVQMAVLVKPNGILGNAYMVAIRPFRHLIVYPALLREMGRAWQGAPA